MNAYRKLVIYYFSGTGNARNVALWVHAVASAMGIESTVADISVIGRQHIEKPPAGALVVFVSPIHGFNYPPVMIRFISNFPRGNNRVVLMNTRAGMLIGRFVTPGLTGIAFYLAALILMVKGFRITGMVPVDLPSNWISLHPGLNERTIAYLHAKNKAKVSLYAQQILTGKRCFKVFHEALQDIIVFPVSVLYYFIGRFMLAKTYYASSDCNHCNLCIKNCPVKAIIRVDNRPFWTYRCESCMKCMSNCPTHAIETAHGFSIGIWLLLTNSALLGFFYQLLVWCRVKIESDILKFIIGQVLFMSLLYLSYRIVHYGMRFKFVERLMVYTSLTWYKFWGRRYKALKG